MNTFKIPNTKYKIQNTNKGFTLVEMLTVLAIIAIVSGIVIFNIGKQRQNSSLLRSAQNLSLDLRRVESFTLSSRIFKTQGIPCGWGIHFNGVGSNSYVIFADWALSQDCSDRDFVRSPDGSEDSEIINFDAGITVSSLGSGLSDIVFSPPGPRVNFTPDQAIAGITLTNRDATTRTITVNKIGLVSSP